MPKQNKSEVELWFERVFDRQKFSDLSADMRKTTHAFFESLTDNSRFSTAFVTREEFAVQKKLVEELIKKLEKIEKQLGIKSTKIAPKKKAAKKKVVAKKAKKAVKKKSK